MQSKVTALNLEPLFRRLSQSTFRQKIALNDKDYFYFQTKGHEIIAKHAADFIKDRIAPAYPNHDGKQTPWRGHPVFVAQHATATCCRSCIAKWHQFSKGIALSDEQQSYLVQVIMYWLNSAKIQPRKDTSGNLSLL